HEDKALFGDKAGEIGVRLLGQNDDPGIRIEEQACLGESLVALADDNDRPAADAEERRECRELVLRFGHGLVRLKCAHYRENCRRTKETESPLALKRRIVLLRGPAF